MINCLSDEPVVDKVPLDSDHMHLRRDTAVVENEVFEFLHTIRGWPSTVNIDANLTLKSAIWAGFGLARSGNSAVHHLVLLAVQKRVRLAGTFLREWAFIHNPYWKVLAPEICCVSVKPAGG